MDRFESLFVACMSTPLAIGPNAPFEKGKDANWGINLNIIGGSGIAKSARIRQCGKLMGLPVRSVFSASKTPEHFGGFPVMLPSGRFSLECAMRQIQDAFDDKDGSIIFLDEISSAPPAVQASLLSWVNERTAGDFDFPPLMRFALAMNPPEIAANGRDIEIPMANRVCHFDYEPPTVKQWFSLMMGSYDPGICQAVDYVALVQQYWRDHYFEVLMGSYKFLEAAGGIIKEKDEDGVETMHSRFYDQPSHEDPRASKAWPSHRTWSQSVNGVTTARCLGMDITVQSDIVAGLVGRGLASEWLNYMKKQNLPTPESILNNPDSFVVSNRLDILHVIMPEITTYIAQEPDEERRIPQGISWLKVAKKIIDAGYGDIPVHSANAFLGATNFGTGHPNSEVSRLCVEVFAPLGQLAKYVAKT
jgi:hypothetical protein